MPSSSEDPLPKQQAPIHLRSPLPLTHGQVQAPRGGDSRGEQQGSRGGGAPYDAEMKSRSLTLGCILRLPKATGIYVEDDDR